MHLLRISRKLNDTLAFVAFLLSFLIMVSLAVLVLISWDAHALTFILGGVAMLLGFCVIKMLAGIISPYQNEFVIEMDRLRYGRADQPNKQRTILRSAVECFILDADSDPSLCVHTGNSVAPHLAPGIIVKAEQMTAVARMLRENWPEVPIYDRPQFQAICRQSRRKVRC